MKTLVIILGQTRAHNLTYENIKKNLIDELNADVALCIGITPDYDYNNPFFTNSKYKFLYNEPNDYEELLDEASEIILSTNKLSTYEKIDNINTLNNKIYHKTTPNSQCIDKSITYLGQYENIELSQFEKDNYEQIIHFNNNYKLSNYQNATFGIKNSFSNEIYEENCTLYKKPISWHEYKKLKNLLLGGIKNKNNEPTRYGSGAIKIFLRWFLLEKLKEFDLINKYDRFIITRSDFIFLLQHPQLHLLNDSHIWIPNGEHFNGFNDKHSILSKNNIEKYLNIFNNMVLYSNKYYANIKSKKIYTFEELLKFHLEHHNLTNNINFIPYIMHTIRSSNESSKNQFGWLSHNNNYFIKYYGEYEKSNDSLKLSKKFNNIQEFYSNIIKYN